MNAIPLIAMVATSATLMAPTVELPETHWATAPNVSIQQVQFASVTTSLSQTAAAAVSANTIGGGAILTGAKIGALAGFELTFIVVGGATISLLGWSPIIGGAISQLITLAASLVAVPVGAVLGAMGAVFNPPSAASVEPKASAATVRAAAVGHGVVVKSALSDVAYGAISGVFGGLFLGGSFFGPVGALVGMAIGAPIGLARAGVKWGIAAIRGSTPWALPATARIKTGAAVRARAKANSVNSVNSTVGGKKHRPAGFPTTSVTSKPPHRVSPNRQTP